MKIYLSPEAASQLNFLCQYLSKYWSDRVREKFLIKFRKAVDTIRRMPFAFPVSEKLPGIRRCVISPLTKIFYRIKNDEIEIIAIVDARQDFD